MLAFMAWRGPIKASLRILIGRGFVNHSKRYNIIAINIDTVSCTLDTRWLFRWLYNFFEQAKLGYYHWLAFFSGFN